MQNQDTKGMFDKIIEIVSYDWNNKLLLTIGTVFGSLALSDVHELLAVVLQVTGLISFLIYVIINWEKMMQVLTKKSNGKDK